MTSWLHLATGSVRLRTTAAATVIVFVALTIAAFALVLVLRHSLTENVDTSIRVRSEDIVGFLREDSFPDSIAIANDEAALIQIVDAQGIVVAASENVVGEPPITDRRPPADVSDIEEAHGLPIDPDEGFRVLARTTTTPAGSYTILIAGSLDNVNETTDALTTILRLAVPILSIVVAGGTWLVVGRALAPVEAIRQEVASIGAEALDHRVPVPASADEIARLAETMNAMLARVQEAYARQERFVADAAHELRSPLASLRVQLEVDGRPEDEHLLDEVIRMQRLVDDLLLLARSDAGALAGPLEAVDLDDIALAEVERLRANSEVRFDTSGLSAGQVSGSPEQLLRIVRNLLENAARHAASVVTVSLVESAEGVLLAVEDDGPGILPGRREQVFERFTRLDSSRARNAGGSGLGLAISRAIAEAHGGTLTIEDGAGMGARFVLRLPATA